MVRSVSVTGPASSSKASKGSLKRAVKRERSAAVAPPASGRPSTAVTAGGTASSTATFKT